MTFDLTRCENYNYTVIVYVLYIQICEKNLTSERNCFIYRAWVFLVFPHVRDGKSRREKQSFLQPRLPATSHRHRLEKQWQLEELLPRSLEMIKSVGPLSARADDSFICRICDRSNWRNGGFARVTRFFFPI